MPSFRPLPQELVDKIIDELGKDYQDHDHEKRPGDRLNVVGEALHACALVSKNWTGRSRVHLFKEVTVKPDGVGSFFVPPVAIMPYVTKLGMVLLYDIYRLSPSPDLLTRLCACPIVFLRITEGALTTARVRLVEFIAAISPTLQTVSFEFCSLPLSLIHHIVLAHPDLKQLHLRSCKIKAPNSDRPTTPQLGTPHSPDLELGVFSSSYFRGQVSLITEIVQLPVKFSKLNFDYALTLGTTHFANALIEANAESLSSLTVHIYDCTWTVLSRKKTLPLTIKPYCSVVSCARRQPPVQPGSLFQLIRATFGYGGHAHVLPGDLRQYSINPQFDKTHPLEVDLVGDELPLQMDPRELPSSPFLGVAPPRHHPLRTGPGHHRRQGGETGLCSRNRV